VPIIHPRRAVRTSGRTLFEALESSRPEHLDFRQETDDRLNMNSQTAEPQVVDPLPNYSAEIEMSSRPIRGKRSEDARTRHPSRASVQLHSRLTEHTGGRHAIVRLGMFIACPTHHARPSLIHIRPSHQQLARIGIETDASKGSPRWRAELKVQEPGPACASHLVACLKLSSSANCLHRTKLYSAQETGPPLKARN
jgi:hypothetical protein